LTDSQAYAHHTTRVNQGTFKTAALALGLGGCLRGATAPTPAERAAALRDPSSTFWSARAPSVFHARVETTRGAFTLEIVRAWAPLGADRFYHLARAGYYDDTRFTRVVPRFIAQFGLARDSATNAVWSSRAFPDDSVRQSNVRGTMAFAMTGPGTRTTQLYISLVDNRRLDAQGFAPIGRVTDGMSVVDRLYSGYGENAGGGVRRGNQGPLMRGGNAYVDRMYPLLDRLMRVTITGQR